MSLLKIKPFVIDDTTASDAYVKANGAFGTANSAALYANAAFLAANNASDSWVRNQANGAFIQANAAFNAANNSLDSWVRVQANTAYNAANSAGSYANSAFAASNTNASSINTVDFKATSASSYANSAFTAANTADSKAVTAGSYANSAFATANNALAKSGGTVSGDLSVTGNLIIGGGATYINTATFQTTDSLIELASNNTTDVTDIGFYGQVNSNTFTGFVKQAGTNNYLLFKGLTNNPTGNTLTAASATAQNVATLIANVAGYSITSNGVDLFLYTTNAYTQANNEPKAVTAGSYANSAFGTANSGASYANSAFTAANTADGKAVTAGSYANSAFTSANTADSKATSAFTAANTADGKAVTAGSYANSAFGTANSAALYANAAFNAANNASDSWVRVQANLAFGTANSAGSYANSAYSAANTNASSINSVNFSTLSAFAAANSASLYANSAFGTANAAFLAANNASDSWVRNQANGAFTQANAAFAAANTASSGSNNLYYDTFTASGSASFTLSVTPPGVNYTIVNIDGVQQLKSAYTLSGSTLTFSETPTTGAKIDITSFQNGVAIYTTRTYTADGTTTNYTVSNGTNQNNVLVTENGLLQTPGTDYTISGTTLTFATAPVSGVKIQIRELCVPSGGTGGTSSAGVSSAKSIVFSYVFGS
jgi:hypothetical protein